MDVVPADGPRDETAAEDKHLSRDVPCCGTEDSSNDVDLESLFSGHDDDDMDSLFGGRDDTEDTEDTSPASPMPVSAAFPLTLPLAAATPASPSTPGGPSLFFPFPLPALPSSLAAAVPVNRNSFCDVSTTLPASNRDDGQRAGQVQDGAAATNQQQQQQQQQQQEQQQQQQQQNQQGAAGAPLFAEADPSGLDINLDLDLEFDFGLDLGAFIGTDDNSLHADVADAEIDFDFRLDAATERQFARELGLELEASSHAADVEADIDTCFFDAAGRAGSTVSAVGAYTAHTPQSVCDAGASAAATLAEAAAPTTAAGSSASTPMVIDTDAASDDVVVLYERPACARPAPTSASGYAATLFQSSHAKVQRKTAPPALQLLSPASEPLSQPSSRQASEEASPAPTTLSYISAVSSVSAAPTVPASLQASIPHYLELRPRCPKTPPPERIDLGAFNVEELLPYVQLHSKLSMVGIQQMLGLDINAGRLVVGECRRYLADPAHRVAPSGTSDAAALRTLKVALIQSALLLLKYGESGACSPQSLQNGVGARWFSRGASPQSMHVWPDDSTTVRERQRQAAALRKAQNLVQSQTPPHSPCPVDGVHAGANPTASARSAPAKLKRGPRCSLSEASAAKHPRLSPGESLPNTLPNTTTATTTSTTTTTHTALPRAPARPRQPILAYNSPCVLRDDLIQSASRRPPAAHNV